MIIENLNRAFTLNIATIAKVLETNFSDNVSQNRQFRGTAQNTPNCFSGNSFLGLGCLSSKEGFYYILYAQAHIIRLTMRTG